MGMITSIYVVVVVRSVLLLLLMALMLLLLVPLLSPTNYWLILSGVLKFWTLAWYCLKSQMKYAFISEDNLLLDTQSVDSCLYILILLNISILQPIFINWSVSLLLHKASFYKTKVTENVHEWRWLLTKTWIWGTLVLEFLECLPLIFCFRLDPGNTWKREWKW